MNVFEGDFSQSGFGLGNIFGSLMRKAIPFIKPLIKKTAKSVGKHGLKLGSDIITDVLSGESPKRSLQKQGKRRLDQIERKLLEMNTAVPTTIKRRKVSKKKVKRRSTKKQQQQSLSNDIFG